MKTESQNTRILNHLKKGRTLTPLQALRLFNCWALSSRIAELNKSQGRIIKSELVTVGGGKKVAKYSMA